MRNTWSRHLYWPAQSPGRGSARGSGRWDPWEGGKPREGVLLGACKHRAKASEISGRGSMYWPPTGPLTVWPCHMDPLGPRARWRAPPLAGKADQGRKKHHTRWIRHPPAHRRKRHPKPSTPVPPPSRRINMVPLSRLPNFVSTGGTVGQPQYPHPDGDVQGEGAERERYAINGCYVVL